MLKNNAIILLSSFVLLAGCGKKNDSNPLIVNGQVSTVKRLPGMLSLDFGDGKCTGTLLENTNGTPGEVTVILTAAHCVVSFLGKGNHEQIYPAESQYLVYSRETDSSLGRKSAEIRKVVIPARFAKKVNGDAHQAVRITELDVALIVVKNLEAGMKGARIDYENRVVPGEFSILAGYGCDNRKFKDGSGILRESTVRVSSVQSSKIVIEKGSNPVQGQICSGDSGGAMYSPNNALLIRGINSSGSDSYSNITPVHRESEAGKWLLTTYPLVTAF